MLLRRPPHGRVLGRRVQGRRRRLPGRARHSRRRRQRLDHRPQRLPAPPRRSHGDARQAGADLQGRGVTPGGPPPDAGGPLSFSYHRALAPMLWMFLAIAIAELLLVHFLVTLWHPRLAIFLSLLSLLGLLWLIGFIRSLRRYPVLIAEDEVRFRLGRLRDVGVPLAGIGLVRLHWPPRW